MYIHVLHTAYTHVPMLGLLTVVFLIFTVASLGFGKLDPRAPELVKYMTIKPSVHT